jgi:hypothetical protein
MNGRPKLPLPSGLIGEAGPVTLDYSAGNPFFPFLSLAQIAMILAIYAIGMGMFALFIRREVLPFTAAGAFVGMLPSIWGGVPCRVMVHSPRPESWADFTRQWAEASSYRQKKDHADVWLPAVSVWRRWPGASIQLRVLEHTLEVRGGRYQMRQLKRNFDHITARGHRWP